MSEELMILGEESARDARAYLSAVTEVASGTSPDTAIPVLLLAVSQVLVAGARLGAITDVVPDERFEADPGPDADVDPVRQGLVNLFEGLDDYVHVVDPLVGVTVAKGSLSNDLAEVAVPQNSPAGLALVRPFRVIPAPLISHRHSAQAGSPDWSAHLLIAAPPMLAF